MKLLDYLKQQLEKSIHKRDNTTIHREYIMHDQAVKHYSKLLEKQSAILRCRDECN